MRGVARQLRATSSPATAADRSSRRRATQKPRRRSRSEADASSASAPSERQGYSRRALGDPAARALVDGKPCGGCQASRRRLTRGAVLLRPGGALDRVAHARRRLAARWLASAASRASAPPLRRRAALRARCSDLRRIDGALHPGGDQARRVFARPAARAPTVPFAQAAPFGRSPRLEIEPTIAFSVAVPIKATRARRRRLERRGLFGELEQGVPFTRCAREPPSRPGCRPTRPPARQRIDGRLARETARVRARSSRSAIHLAVASNGRKRSVHADHREQEHEDRREDY
jgi:hypothetical protein